MTLENIIANEAWRTRQTLFLHLLISTTKSGQLKHGSERLMKSCAKTWHTRDEKCRDFHRIKQPDKKEWKRQIMTIINDGSENITSITTEKRGIMSLLYIVQSFPLFGWFAMQFTFFSFLLLLLLLRRLKKVFTVFETSTRRWRGKEFERDLKENWKKRETKWRQRHLKQCRLLSQFACKWYGSISSFVVVVSASLQIFTHKKNQ